MKHLLLDTHAALFWWRDNPQLGAKAREAISDSANVVRVSAASAWEVGTKYWSGKLDDIGDPAVRFPALIAQHGFLPLDVTHEHGLRAGLLDGAHRDPFDRLIAAQALVEGLTVVTRDREIARFGCEVLW